MRDRTIIPTNLLDWPRCQSLLPDQRLILLWVWSCPYMTAAGHGFVPVKPAAATLGLDPEALVGGLDSLEQAGLIARDASTGEIFVLDWYRFHRFKGPAAASVASSIKKVQSERLKRLILEKSMGCLPTTTTTTTTTVSCKQETATASPAGGAVRARKKQFLVCGITCWTPEDRQQAKDLAEEYGGEIVKAVADDIRRCGAEPLPSVIAKTLKGKKHGNIERGNPGHDDAIRAAVNSSMQYYGIGPVERATTGEVVT